FDSVLSIHMAGLAAIHSRIRNVSPGHRRSRKRRPLGREPQEGREHPAPQALEKPTQPQAPENVTA
ncbi:hypothetical protein, partial [Nocardia gipuzkoensis]